MTAGAPLCGMLGQRPARPAGLEERERRMCRWRRRSFPRTKQLRGPGQMSTMARSASLCGSWLEGTPSTDRPASQRACTSSISCRSSLTSRCASVGPCLRCLGLRRPKPGCWERMCTLFAQPPNPLSCLLVMSSAKTWPFASGCWKATQREGTKPGGAVGGPRRGPQLRLPSPHSPRDRRQASRD